MSLTLIKFNPDVLFAVVIVWIVEFVKSLSGGVWKPKVLLIKVEVSSVSIVAVRWGVASFFASLKVSVFIVSEFVIINSAVVLGTSNVVDGTSAVIVGASVVVVNTVVVAGVVVVVLASKWKI